MSNSDILRKIIIYITYTIILYIIIEEIYNITIFVFNYNKYYDYGLMLRKICNNEYYEYETERFQLSKTITNLRLNNDTYNKANYMIIILIMSIFMSSVISFIFAKIFYHNFIEDYRNCTKLNNEDSYQDSIIKKIILCLCPICGELSDCTFTYLIYLFILILIPLYIFLKIGLNIDIGFYSTYTDNNKYNMYIIFFLILIILRFPINYLDKYRFVNKSSSIFLYYLYFIVYMLSMYFISNIIEIYNSYINNYNELLNEDLTDEEKFYKYCSKDIIENITDEEEVSIFNNILSNMFGLYSFKEEGSIYDDSGIFVKNFSRYIYIIGILLIITYILYLCIFKFNFLTFLIKRAEDYIIIYNYIILPFLSMFFILLIINCTTIYNSYVNKYILYNPLALYKNDLDKLYKSFDVIVLNDRSAFEDPKAVCKNIANAVHIVLYSTIFKFNITNGLINDVNTLKLLGSQSPTSANINTTPVFTYDNCDDPIHNSESKKYYDIHTSPEYDILSKIINQGATGRNIFLNSNGSVNNDVFKFILLNVYPIFSSSTPTDNDYLVIGDKIKYNLKAAMCNIGVLGRNSTGFLPLENNNLSNSEFFITEQHDDRKYITGSRDNDKILYNNSKKYNEFLSDYDNLIDNIQNEYISFLKKTRGLVNDLMTQIENCELITLDPSKSLSNRLKEDLLNCNDDIKKKYVAKLTLIIKITFDNINKFLSENKKSRKVSTLTNYIISNYNNIYTDNHYIKQDFITKSTPYKINYDATHATVITTAEQSVINYQSIFDNALSTKISNPSGQNIRDYDIATSNLIVVKQNYDKLLTPSTRNISSDPNFGDEERATIISSNANNVSFSIVLVSCIYIFLLLEPIYIEQH